MNPWGPPQPACWPPHPSQTPGQYVAPYDWSQAAPPTAAPPNPDIALTISEMLSQPQVRRVMYQRVWLNSVQILLGYLQCYKTISWKRCSICKAQLKQHWLICDQT